MSWIFLSISAAFIWAVVNVGNETGVSVTRSSVDRPFSLPVKSYDVMLFNASSWLSVNIGVPG